MKLISMALANFLSHFMTAGARKPRGPDAGISDVDA